MRIKLFISIVLVVMSLMQIYTFASLSVDLSIDTTYQPEGTSFLSKEKSVTYSSNYNSGTGNWKASGLVDGKIGMGNPLGWTTDPNDPEATIDKEVWIQIDLAEVFSITRMVLFPRQDQEPVVGYPVDFTLQISVDGENWTEVATKTDQRVTDHEAKLFDFEAKNARYVKMHCTKRAEISGKFYVQLAEMAVYGSAKVETSPETFDNSASILPLILMLLLVASFARIANRKRV